MVEITTTDDKRKRTKPYRFLAINEMAIHEKYCGTDMSSLHGLEGAKYIGVAQILDDGTVNTAVESPTVVKPLILVKIKPRNRQSIHIVTDGEVYYLVIGKKHFKIYDNSDLTLSVIDQMPINEEIRFVTSKFA